MGTIDGSADPHLEVEVRTYGDGTALDVSLARPEKLNSLPASSAGALVAVLEAVSEGEYDAVVVRGAGDQFCAGADIEELRDEIVSGNPVDQTRVHDVVDAIRSCPVPVVTEVTGIAFGLGFLVCMAADVVVAGEDATFGMKEVTLGIPIAGWASVLLPEIVGDRRARDWLLTGRSVDCETAVEAGFVTVAAPKSELAERTGDYVDRLAASSSRAVGVLKDRLSFPVDDAERERIRVDETEALASAYETGGVLERIDAVLDD
ncbi:enoyl-CoA hydratase/isomerase family protein [Halorubellus sp. JP-L1]|uniref:enoyl-CoA hydratase/isomerase family protein n=1 Tax=Halorubellus sp. JP-L1 TaxID=2715753 RepID=UPI0014090B21|nr:enoyl-CoA hydratase/isomerase family protein [Halorubellus sp. JP-L1]NHN42815.1 enoyl-CoA hydratase/isomerase family protein [Halorubellus sp. JP-L1]